MRARKINEDIISNWEDKSYLGAFYEEPPEDYTGRRKNMAKIEVPAIEYENREDQENQQNGSETSITVYIEDLQGIIDEFKEIYSHDPSLHAVFEEYQSNTWAYYHFDLDEFEDLATALGIEIYSY